MSLMGSFFGGKKDDKDKRSSGRRKKPDESSRTRKPGSKSRHSVRRTANKPSSVAKKPKLPSSIVLPEGSKDASKPEAPGRPHKIRTSPKNKRLGQLLIKAGVLNEDTLDDLLDEQQESGGLLGRLLIKKGLANIKDVGAALKKQRTITTILIPNVEFDPEVLTLLDKDFCIKNRLIPIERIGNQLCLAMSNVLDTNAKNDVKEKTQLSIKAFDADWQEVKAAIEKHMVDGGKSEQVQEKPVAEELEIELPDEDLIETMIPMVTAGFDSPIMSSELVEDEETVDSAGIGKDRETEFTERPRPEQVVRIGGDVAVEIEEFEEVVESDTTEEEILVFDIADIEEVETISEVPEVAKDKAAVEEEPVMDIDEIEDIEEIEEITEQADLTEIEEPVDAEVGAFDEVLDVDLGEFEEADAVSEVPEIAEEQPDVIEIEAVAEESAEAAELVIEIAELDDIEEVAEIKPVAEEPPLLEIDEEIVEITEEIEEYAEADTMASPPIPGKLDVEEIHDIGDIEVIGEVAATISLSPLPAGKLDGIPITADYFAEIVQWDMADPERRWLAEHLADNVLPVTPAPDLAAAS